MSGNNPKGPRCDEQHVLFNTSRRGAWLLAGWDTQHRGTQKMSSLLGTHKNSPKIPILIPIDPKSLCEFHQQLTYFKVILKWIKTWVHNIKSSSFHHHTYFSPKTSKFYNSIQTSQSTLTIHNSSTYKHTQWFNKWFKSCSNNNHQQIHGFRTFKKNSQNDLFQNINYEFKHINNLILQLSTYP